ncbi:MAG: SH3 domain-containing protein [Planctomycetes bacterium]|nr:SH3 domain-containing protein [Planctomycetota bacterium]
MRIRIVAVLLAVSAAAALAAPMSVQIRNGKVKARPSPVGTVVATMDYGDKVEAGTPEKGWYPVTTLDGKTGWMHESALTRKTIVMRAGTTDAAVGVSSDEVALAGKGFNQQVEDKLRQEGKLDYTWVDRMTAFVVSADAIAQFLTQGHLAGGDQ